MAVEAFTGVQTDALGFTIGSDRSTNSLVDTWALTGPWEFAVDRRAVSRDRRARTFEQARRRDGLRRQQPNSGSIDALTAAAQRYVAGTESWDAVTEATRRLVTARRAAGPEITADEILVPYAAESVASGKFQPTREAFDYSNYLNGVWYRRELVIPRPSQEGEGIEIVFPSVEYWSAVMIDGELVGRHVGTGRFSVDVSKFADGRPHTLTVAALDPGADRSVPRGKQDVGSPLDQR